MPLKRPVGLHVLGGSVPTDFDTVLYQSLWDPVERTVQRRDVHLLLARSGAAEWCPETIYFLRCQDYLWEVYDPTKRTYYKVFKTKKPLGYLEVSSVSRLVFATEPTSTDTI